MCERSSLMRLTITFIVLSFIRLFSIDWHIESIWYLPCVWIKKRKKFTWALSSWLQLFWCSFMRKQINNTIKLDFEHSSSNVSHKHLMSCNNTFLLVWRMMSTVRSPWTQFYLLLFYRSKDMSKMTSPYGRTTWKSKDKCTSNYFSRTHILIKNL